MSDRAGFDAPDLYPPLEADVLPFRGVPEPAPPPRRRKSLGSLQTDFRRFCAALAHGREAIAPHLDAPQLRELDAALRVAKDRAGWPILDALGRED